MQLEPLNYEFKLNLSIALDDLGGVVRNERDFDSARQLFQEAKKLFAELVESDPDHLQYRTRLLHTQLHHAAMERDLAQYTPAGELFRAALEHLRRLERDGTFENLRPRTSIAGWW